MASPEANIKIVYRLFSADRVWNPVSVAFIRSAGLSIASPNMNVKNTSKIVYRLFNADRVPNPVSVTFIRSAGLFIASPDINSKLHRK